MMPAGVLITVPDPAPDFVMVRIAPDAVNVAVTDALALIVTEHPPVPEHAPLQPAKT